MKKWIFFLAVPYVVETTTTIYKTMDGEKPVVGFTINEYPCGSTKEMCDDMSESLNEAHERREEKAHQHDGLTPDEIAKGCFKNGCNTCCPIGANGYGGLDCTAMECL